VLTEFDFRSRPEFRAARELVRSGQIGEPVLATAQKSYRFGSRPGWYADRAIYAGTLLWIASHGVDAIRFTTGKRLVRVTGQGGNLSQPKFGTMEDHVTALFELENGGTGIVHADYLRPPAAPTHGDDRLRVAGTKGVLEVRSGKCTLIGADGEKDVTESVKTQPMHLELLAAIRGDNCDLYCTQSSLELAETLLKARDAVDGRKWL
jgi:predicted dehydrogenase